MSLKSSSATATSNGLSAEKQLDGFIAKFDPKVGRLIRDCRREMRKILPTALELVYDNYNFFVIGYATSERAVDWIVSLASAANGVILSFYHGATLPDPQKLLLGAGKQNRFVRLPAADSLRSAAVVKLIHAAVAQAKTPLPSTGKGRLVIKSISAKQRPRRKG